MISLAQAKQPEHPSRGENRMTIRRARSPAETGVSLGDTLLKAGLAPRYVELFVQMPYKLVHVEPRRPFREPGAPRDEVMLVRAGILAKFKSDGGGRRQIVALRFPGEGILPHEGIEAFKRILSNPIPPQVVVSARDLQASIAEMSSITTADVIEEIKQIEVARPATMHPRPASLANYEAPQNEVERTLVEIFQNMLGIEQVGIHDNFFELGGDSVLGIQIIAQAKRAGIHLTPQQIFQHPTVAEMAGIATDKQPEKRSPAPAMEEETEIDLSLTKLDQSQMNELMAMIDEDETQDEEAGQKQQPNDPDACERESRLNFRRREKRCPIARRKDVEQTIQDPGDSQVENGEREDHHRRGLPLQHSGNRRKETGRFDLDDGNTRPSRGHPALCVGQRKLWMHRAP